jgi:hypothetical protein
VPDAKEFSLSDLVRDRVSRQIYLVDHYVFNGNCTIYQSTVPSPAGTARAGSPQQQSAGHSSYGNQVPIRDDTACVGTDQQRGSATVHPTSQNGLPSHRFRSALLSPGTTQTSPAAASAVAEVERACLHPLTSERPPPRGRIERKETGNHGPISSGYYAALAPLRVEYSEPSEIQQQLPPQPKARGTYWLAKQAAFQQFKAEGEPGAKAPCSASSLRPFEFRTDVICQRDHGTPDSSLANARPPIFCLVPGLEGSNSYSNGGAANNDTNLALKQDMNDWEQVVAVYMPQRRSNKGQGSTASAQRDIDSVEDRKILEKRRTICKVYHSLGRERFERAIGFKLELGQRIKRRMYHVLARCRAVNAIRKRSGHLPEDPINLDKLITDHIARRSNPNPDISSSVGTEERTGKAIKPVPQATLLLPKTRDVVDSRLCSG